tara:strand:+ start:729 stop:1070 length:342 start_codon:yes stop_codon:yes gene_type:complete
MSFVDEGNNKFHPEWCDFHNDGLPELLLELRQRLDKIIEPVVEDNNNHNDIWNTVGIWKMHLDIQRFWDAEWERRLGYSEREYKVSTGKTWYQEVDDVGTVLVTTDETGGDNE